jgi:hypothetical protein
MVDIEGATEESTDVGRQPATRELALKENVLADLEQEENRTQLLAHNQKPIRPMGDLPLFGARKVLAFEKAVAAKTVCGRVADARH